MPLLRRIGTREQALATVDACGRYAWVPATAGALLLSLPEVATSPRMVALSLVLQLSLFGLLGYLLRRFHHHLAAALMLGLAGLAMLGALTAFAGHWAASAGAFAEIADLLAMLAYGVLVWVAMRGSEAAVKLRGRFSEAWRQAEPGFSLFSRIETRGQACAVIDDSSRGFILLQVIGLLSSCTHRQGVYGDHSLNFALAVGLVAYLMGRLRSRVAAAALVLMVGGALALALLDLRGSVGRGFWSALVSLAVSAFLVFVGLRALEATIRLRKGLPESV